MPTPIQEERIGKAIDHIRSEGGIPTPGLVWNYIEDRWPTRPGFKNKRAVAQVMKILRARNGPRIPQY